MKLSQFNILLSYANLKVIYNTMWNSAIIIPQKNTNSWGISEEDSIDIEQLDDAKKNLMINNHILVSDDLNEVESAQKILFSTNHNSEKYEITIIPTLACNFRCWYCYENHDRCDFMDETDINRIISFIHQTITERPFLKKLYIQFFGGEPLLKFNHIVRPMLERIENIAKKCGIDYEASFTTNAALINEEKIKFLKKHNTVFLQITIDGNKEKHNKVRYRHREDNTFDLVVNNIKIAIHHGINVSIRLNISEDTDLDVDELLTSFEDLSVEERKLFHFSVHKVWQANKSVYETIFNIVYQIRKRGFHAMTYHTAPSSLWHTCYADKENHITINPQGKIFKCTARDFHENQIEGLLQMNGTISWTELHSRRNSISVFNKTKCRLCPILPICVGGCSQKLIEHEEDPDFCQIEDESGIKEYALKVFNEKLNSGEIGITN